MTYSEDNKITYNEDSKMTYNEENKMTHSELISMQNYFKILDERDNLYNEVKMMHPEDQRLVLPLYVDECDHHFIEGLISQWQKEKEESERNNSHQNQIQRKIRKKYTDSA